MMVGEKFLIRDSLFELVAWMFAWTIVKALELLKDIREDLCQSPWSRASLVDLLLDVLFSVVDLEDVCSEWMSCM